MTGCLIPLDNFLTRGSCHDFWTNCQAQSDRHWECQHPLADVFQAVQGDYKLLGHEMAHQFHFYLEKANKRLFDCIESLHSAAKLRDIFSDGYAKSSVYEYFAQGITYYPIPEDAPPLSGLNRSWAEKTILICTNS